jgi:hypothetical protein
VEPGIGHLLFSHRDANGDDVILRELAAVNGDSIRNAKEMKKAVATRTEVDMFAQTYRREPLFRKWFDGKYGHEAYVKMIQDKDFKAIKSAQTEWRVIVDRRNAELLQHIKDTENWAPDFYFANKAEIDGLELNNKQHADSKIVKEYRQFLKKQTPEIQARYATASDDIYVIPEKTVRADKPQNIERRAKAGKPAQDAQVEAAATPNRQPSSLRRPVREEKHYMSAFARASYLME